MSTKMNNQQIKTIKKAITDLQLQDVTAFSNRDDLLDEVREITWGIANNLTALLEGEQANNKVVDSD